MILYVIRNYETENNGVQFNATDLSSGTYFYRLQSGDGVKTKKMVFIE